MFCLQCYAGFYVLGNNVLFYNVLNEQLPTFQGSCFLLLRISLVC